EWLVADIYEKYKADKASVDEKWAEIFARLEAASTAENTQQTAPSQTAAVTQPAQQQAAKPAAAPAKTPVASESTVTATNSTKPPKPKVRRAEASPLAITSEPSIAPREDRAKEDADTVKEDEWIRLRGMPQAIANNMD